MGEEEMPGWAGGDADASLATEESTPVLRKTSNAEIEGPSASSMGHSGKVPSSERSFLHKVYRMFKTITVLVALLLLIAQVVSVVYLPFDGVEMVLKIFVSTFSALIVLNELEWWGMLRNSPILYNWIPRGCWYAFLGIVSVEENDVKPQKSITKVDLSLNATAAMFIETASWMMFAMGVFYVLFGLCCCQRYCAYARDDYVKRQDERKQIFDEGLRIDSAV